MSFFTDESNVGSTGNPTTTTTGTGALFEAFGLAMEIKREIAHSWDEMDEELRDQLWRKADEIQLILDAFIDDNEDDDKKKTS